MTPQQGTRREPPQQQRIPYDGSGFSHSTACSSDERTTTATVSSTPPHKSEGATDNTPPKPPPAAPAPESSPPAPTKSFTFPRTTYPTTPRYPPHGAQDRFEWAARLGSHEWGRATATGDYEALFAKDLFACAVLDSSLERNLAERALAPARTARMLSDWIKMSDQCIVDAYEAAASSLPPHAARLAPSLNAVGRFCRAALDLAWTPSLDSLNGPPYDYKLLPIDDDLIGRFDPNLDTYRPLLLQWVKDECTRLGEQYEKENGHPLPSFEELRAGSPLIEGESDEEVVFEDEAAPSPKYILWPDYKHMEREQKDGAAAPQAAQVAQVGGV